MYINFIDINYHRIKSKNIGLTYNNTQNDRQVTLNNTHDDIINLQPIQSHIQKEKDKKTIKRHTQRQKQKHKKDTYKNILQCIEKHINTQAPNVMSMRHINI